MQSHGSIRIRVLGNDDLVANRSADAELFHQLTSKTRLVRLAGLAFAAGELPESGEVSVIESSRDEELSFAFDDRREDDDGRAISGHVRG